MSPALAIMAAQVPSAPTNVVMVTQSATQIQISWQVSDNGGTPLLTYRIYSNGGTGGSTFSQIVPDIGGTASTYTITSGIVTDQVY